MKDINSLVNTAVAMEIGEPERDVVPVGGYAVASLIGVHGYVVQRVGPTQPVNEDVRDHAPLLTLRTASLPVFDQGGDLKGICLVRIETPAGGVQRV